jgi:predicted GNAT family acetyltransferase
MIRIEFEKESKRALAYDEELLVGECTFEEKDNVWNINHTFVNGKYQGQGIAKKLVLIVIDNAKAEGKEIIADCSYAAKVIEKL